MKGIEILRKRINDLIENKYNDYIFDKVEKGFEFRILGYPYIFKILCYEQIGWNVYLELNGENVLIEHPETDKLYIEIENIIDEINFKYYGLDENIKPMIEKSFKKLDIALSEFKHVISTIEKNDLKYDILFPNIDNKISKMSIKYSISMNNWNVEREGIFREENLHDSIFQLFSNIKLMIKNFNKDIDSLNYYF